MKGVVNLKTIDRRIMGRRTFVKSVAAAGVAFGVAGAAWSDAGISEGDAAILRFLAAAEILESDFWEQYTELSVGNPAYKEALEAIDEDNPDYIEQNTDDEFSHADFLNAFLTS